jgi:hypothetical protein
VGSSWRQEEEEEEEGEELHGLGNPQKQLLFLKFKKKSPVRNLPFKRKLKF